jgi:hypothetical protein
LRHKEEIFGSERALHREMILLVTSCSRAQECAATLQRDLGHSTEIAASVRRALEVTRCRAFAAIVIDENQADADPVAAEALYRELDGAVPITLNLAISGTERVVREVRSALRRRESERRLALHSATRELRSEITDAVTGILLSSQLALENPDLPPAATEQLRAVYQLAAGLRERLGPANALPGRARPAGRAPA